MHYELTPRKSLVLRDVLPQCLVDAGLPATAVPRRARENIASVHSGLSMSVISGSAELFVTAHLTFVGFALVFGGVEFDFHNNDCSNRNPGGKH